MFTLNTLLAFYLKPEKRMIKKWMTDQLNNYRQELAANMPTQRVVFEIEQVRKADNLLYDFVRGNPHKITLCEVMEAYAGSGYFEIDSGYYILPLTERMQSLEFSIPEVIILFLSALADDDEQVRAYIPRHCLKYLEKEEAARNFLEELESQLSENQAVWIDEVRDKLASTPLTGSNKARLNVIIEPLKKGRRIYDSLQRTRNIGQVAQRFFDETRQGIISDELKAVTSKFCQQFLQEYPYIQDNQYYIAEDVFLRNKLFLEVIFSQPLSKENSQQFTFFCEDFAPPTKRCALA